jgi:YD repeat-containing protein
MNTGTTRWTYDPQGRVLRKTQQIANRTFVTQYRYDASGRVDSITYPSGQRIEFLYSNGLVTQISANGATLLRDIHSGLLGSGSGGMARPTAESSTRMAGWWPMTSGGDGPVS